MTQPPQREGGVCLECRGEGWRSVGMTGFNPSGRERCPACKGSGRVPSPGVRDALAKAAAELCDKIMKNREKYIEAFVAETGLLPSECELVEERMPGGDKIVVRVTYRKHNRNPPPAVEARPEGETPPPCFWCNSTHNAGVNCCGTVRVLNVLEEYKEKLRALEAEVTQLTAENERLRKQVKQRECPHCAENLTLVRRMGYHYDTKIGAAQRELSAATAEAERLRAERDRLRGLLDEMLRYAETEENHRDEGVAARTRAALAEAKTAGEDGEE